MTENEEVKLFIMVFVFLISLFFAIYLMGDYVFKHVLSFPSPEEADAHGHNDSGTYVVCGWADVLTPFKDNNVVIHDYFCFSA